MISRISRFQQVDAAERAHDFAVLVDHGEGAVFVVLGHFAHVVHVVGQPGGAQVRGAAHPGNGDGLEDHPRGAVGLMGRGDHQAAAVDLPRLFGDAGLAHHDAGHVGPQRGQDDVRLAAADQHGVPVQGQRLFAVGRQRDGYAAADAVGGLAGVQHDAALQRADQVEHGDVIDLRVQHRAHVLGGDGVGGQHAEQRAVVLHHRQGHGVFVLVQQLPGVVHRHGLVQHRRGIEVQVADLRAQVVDQHRRLKAEAVQHQLGLVADAAQPRRHVFPVAQRVAQLGVGHGGDDGIGVGVAVPGDVDRIHSRPSVVSISYGQYSTFSGRLQ